MPRRQADNCKFTTNELLKFWCGLVKNTSAHQVSLKLLMIARLTVRIVIQRKRGGYSKTNWWIKTSRQPSSLLKEVHLNWNQAIHHAKARPTIKERIPR